MVGSHCTRPCAIVLLLIQSYFFRFSTKTSKRDVFKEKEIINKLGEELKQELKSEIQFHPPSLSPKYAHRINLLLPLLLSSTINRTISEISLFFLHC